MSVEDSEATLEEPSECAGKYPAAHWAEKWVGIRDWTYRYVSDRREQLFINLRTLALRQRTLEPRFPLDTHCFASDGCR